MSNNDNFLLFAYFIDDKKKLNTEALGNEKLAY